MLAFILRANAATLFGSIKTFPLLREKNFRCICLHLNLQSIGFTGEAVLLESQLRFTLARMKNCNKMPQTANRQRIHSFAVFLFFFCKRNNQ